MSDKTGTRSLWDEIKENAKKPFVKWKKKPVDPGKKLMITALISIETRKLTVLLKDACHKGKFFANKGPAVLVKNF